MVFKQLIIAVLLMVFNISFVAANEKNADKTVDGLDLRDVIVVGNNWDGTIDIYDPFTYTRIKKLNAVPDKAERIEELSLSLIHI